MRRIVRRALIGLGLTIIVYLASIGPAGVILQFYAGEAGGPIWNTMYHAPLSRLPRTGRDWVNAYLGYCSNLHLQFWQATHRR